MSDCVSKWYLFSRWRPIRTNDPCYAAGVPLTVNSHGDLTHHMSWFLPLTRPTLLALRLFRAAQTGRVALMNLGPTARSAFAWEWHLFTG